MVSRFFQIAILVLGTLVVNAPCQTLPHLEGETLSGKPIILPDAAHGKIALLTMGFSKKGGHVCGEWQKRFNQDFGKNASYAAYPVAVLEDMPRFVRGMATGGMRRDTPPEQLDKFVLLFHDEAEWKKFVGYAASDDAYLLLLDGKGEVRWRGHGVLQEKDYAPLREAAKQLATK